MLRKIILLLISALLIVLAFPGFGIHGIIWFAFIPFFSVLSKTGIKQRFILGYLFGLIMFTGLLYWVFNVSVPGAIVLILFVSIYPALFSLYKIERENV